MSKTWDAVVQTLEKFPETRNDIRMLYLRVAKALHPAQVIRLRGAYYVKADDAWFITLACSIRRYRARLRHVYAYDESLEEHLQDRGEQERGVYARGMAP